MDIWNKYEYLDTFVDIVSRYLANVGFIMTMWNFVWLYQVMTINCFSFQQVVTAIATIDDLNYPEKTETYYVVNAPYIFSTCWKVQ